MNTSTPVASSKKLVRQQEKGKKSRKKCREVDSSSNTGWEGRESGGEGREREGGRERERERERETAYSITACSSCPSI